jgi:hypothetical protein
MNGRRGEFYNVIWPAYLGALAALASGRFAAAISQARLPHTLQAETWIMLEPGWTVRDVSGGHAIEVSYEPAPIH